MSARIPRVAALLALTLAACDHGHYALRDRHVDTTGDEATDASQSDTQSDTTQSDATQSDATQSDATQSDATQSDDTQRDTAQTTESAVPRDESRVTITVRTTSGPVTAAVARVALSTQRTAVDACYRRVLGPEASGSIRASLSIEASGAPRVELETMTPALDRVIPCVDQALERTRFPASADGRPTHVIAEVSRTP